MVLNVIVWHLTKKSGGLRDILTLLIERVVDEGNTVLQLD
jgi:hypothetical protein